MTRSFLAVFAATAFVAIATSPGCKTTGVGDPCIPEQEYDTTFNGFDQGEVSVESKSFQCETRLCLVNHFRGRVTCAYGQTASGAAPADATEPCEVPGTYGTTSPEPIVGAGGSDGALVDPQCVDRTANNAVYCSCRCANINGQTNDGANYCSCPDSYTCTQLVVPTGSNVNQGLTGAYCIRNGTAYDPATSCSKGDCDAKTTPCGTSGSANFQD
jgi:hypothetical protein